MNTKELSELTRNNRHVKKAHTIDVLVMLILCLMQTLSGKFTWGYTLSVSAIGLFPVIAEYYFWKRNKETPAIKHLAAIGFAIFYTIILFTSPHSLAFLFVIPMILAVSVYNDTRYMILINTGTILESILVNVIGATTGKCAYSGIDAAIIQVVVMILIGIYSYSTAKTLGENSAQKLEHLTAAQSQTETVLSDISRLSEQLKTGIEGIYHDLEQLDKAAVTTKDAMQEVSDGASDTAQAVQEQLLQTEAIQKKVALVCSAAESITDHMQQTLQALETGRMNVETLVNKVDISVSNSEDVADKLRTLNQYMEKMHSIVELIGGITSQTSLLALNASIEAARAGEAGRGFSVVATEISAMAAQTKTATAGITELIFNVTSAISEVVAVIQQMISGIREEKSEAELTSGSFSAIADSTYSVQSNVETLTKDIAELKTANQIIAESIQTVSAVSEEVSAHASETMQSEIENSDILTGISEKMEQLIRLAH